MEPENHNRLVAGTFQCQGQLSQARSLVITGHIYDDDTPEQISKRVDCAQNELDRQFTRCDVLNKEMQRKAMLGGIEQVKEQLETFKARQDGRGSSATGLSTEQQRPIKLSAQEKLALQNGDQQIKTMLRNIEQLDKDILDGKRKLGMVV